MTRHKALCDSGGNRDLPFPLQKTDQGSPNGLFVWVGAARSREQERTTLERIDITATGSTSPPGLHRMTPLSCFLKISPKRRTK